MAGESKFGETKLEIEGDEWQGEADCFTVGGLSLLLQAMNSSKQLHAGE